MANAQIVIFAFFYELFGGLFCLIMFLLTLKRYIERRRAAILYLSCSMLILGLAVLISSIGRLAALLAGVNPITYHGYFYIPFVWIGLALVLNVIGDVTLLLFSNEIFYNSSNKLKWVFIISGGMIAGLLLLLVPTPPVNPVTGEPSAAYMSMFTLMWLLHAMFTFFTGGQLMISALRLAVKDRPLVEKRGLQLISILGIGLALTNIMFIIDEQTTIYFGGDFSIFYFLGWFFAYIGVIFSYLGLILPNWLRKRWE